MATDFSYNGKTINSSGPIKPSGKNQPLDPRTEVKLYADIESIPSPYVGMIITVLEDETNSNKMTDYKVLSLKANVSGIANSVVDQVQRYVDYLGASSGESISQEDINTAVNNYLTEHPVSSGATVEQAAQIQANKTAIGDENSGLTKGLNDISTLTIPGFVPSETIYEFDDVDNTWMTGSDNKTLAITSNEFLANWYDIYLGLHDDGMLVTKNLIGYDQTGEYPVYEYDFKPKNYNRTILLSSGLHAYELSASFGLAHIIKDLMTTPYKHEGFKYMRENVRIKIIPILNPWGYNQTPKVYANSNGVNPNRNFNFEGSWDAYPNKPGDEWNYKGTEPFSEQETKNIANWLYYNKEIADFWIDCHTGYDDSSHDIWCLYQSYSSLVPKIESARSKLVDRIKTRYGVTTVNDHAQVDYVNNIKIEWSEKAIGIPMMVIEQSPLNNKWKTGSYNNNGGAIREYATQAYVFIQELLSCENVKFNLLDYIYSLKDYIFNNSCKQIPYYANSSYPMFINAGGSFSGGSETTEKTYDLKVNNGSCASVDGVVSSSTTRMFSNYIAIDSSTVSVTKNTSIFMLTLRYFDKDKNYISAYNGNYASTLTDSAVPGNAKYIVLQICKTNNTDTITSSDVSGTVTINNKTYKLVYDGTLSLAGSATTTYSVTNNLTNVTNDNSAMNIAEGGSYIATLTVNDGYRLDSVTITMGGSDITLTSYTNGSINISNVTGNIVITANATLIPTSGFALNKTSISIMEGDTEQLIATLNGLDVTSSTNWSSDNSNATVVGGLVTGVTVGNSIITATKNGESATCSVNIVGVNYLTCTNTAISSADGTETSSTTRISTDYIPVTITDNKLKLICTNSYQYTIRLYDSSKQYLNIVSGTAFKDSTTGWGTGTENVVDSNLNSNVAYIRILFRADSTGTTLISTIDGTFTVNTTEYTLTM